MTRRNRGCYTPPDHVIAWAWERQVELADLIDDHVRAGGSEGDPELFGVHVELLDCEVIISMDDPYSRP